MIRIDGTEPLNEDSHVVKFRTNAICVDVVRGPDAGKTFKLSGPAVTIGADETCQLVLSDATVSRRHAEVRMERGQIRVCDLDSRNGTTIDGMRIRDAYPRPDSLIQVGNTVLRLRMSSDTVEIPISSATHFGRLHGTSTAMRLVFAALERIAPQDTFDVLIEGETGTGKELTAEAIHDTSPRAKKPFVVLDCSAAHDNLFESDIFGHAKGAFTGAIKNRPGAFEEANGGTLFLDEIGELPSTLQPKLLRALQEREVRRMGENHYRKVNVRVIAATNRCLATEVEQKRFRQDLYYRLAGLHVKMPALRERIEDIPLLVRTIEKNMGIPPEARLPDVYVKDLASQAWPGNVRELWHVVRRAYVMGTPRAEDEVTTEVVPAMPGVTLARPLLEGREAVKDAYERAYIQLALQQCNGKVSQAAALAGVGRKFFWRAMRRYGIRSGN